MSSWPRSAASSSSTRAWPTRPRPVFADLNTNVHNYWDRGLMGLAVDPGYPTRPYVYVLYAYNHILGEQHRAAALAVGRCARPPGSKYDDRCPNPPQGTADGCVISGRLSRLTVERRRHERQRARPDRGLVPAVPEPLARQPAVRARRARCTHPAARARASTSVADYGQLGGTLPGTPTPVNPCGDPGGADPSPPTRRGRRAPGQDMRTSGDPVDARRRGHPDRPRHRRRLARRTPPSARATPTPGGSSPTACATRTGSRSSRARTRSGSATSGSTRGRSSTGWPIPTRPRATSAGRATRAARSCRPTPVSACPSATA